MSEITSREKALSVHNRILISANLIQQSLWDLGTSLKEMRDGKLYKELGYSNFEDYCETEIGFTRANAHKYISIIEKVNTENVSPVKQLGLKKLYLLSTLTEENQQKIAESTDLSSTTYRELESKVKALKEENKSLSEQVESAGEKIRSVIDDRDKLQSLVESMEDEIEELQNRPVSITTETEFDKAMKVMERDDRIQRIELEEEYNQHKKNLQEMFAQDKEKLKAEYEEKLRRQAVQPANSARVKFDALFQLCEAEIDSLFLTALKDETGKVHYQDKFNKLINIIKEKQEAI